MSRPGRKKKTGGGFGGKRRSREQAGSVRSDSDEQPQPFPVWDLPVRVLHWALVFLFLLQWVTAETRILPAAFHIWGGYLLFVVVLTRVGWGWFGSESARFTRFVKGPRALVAYLPRLLSGKPTRWPGHNPIGALYVVGILSLLLLASLTGLFYESWGDSRGPLAERVSRDTVIWLSDAHDLLLWPIVGMIAVHVPVTLSYWLFKSENRIGPMFGRGRIRLERDPRLGFVAATRAIWTGLVCLALVLALAWSGPIG